MNTIPKTTNWKKIVGRSFSPASFQQYCLTLRWTTWKPSLIVLHNTSIPSLAQRPTGLTATHLKNLEHYYRNTQKWSAGPHLFIDDRQIWVFTPLTRTGVHSPSWNETAIGIEMLGNYEKESFSTGRGLLVRQHTVSAMATLTAVLGLDITMALKLHREDQLTTHQCPGKAVNKGEMIAEVGALLLARRADAG